jgi:hypothetical protein
MSQNNKSLLLNASNMENFPIYPYAFIQVPAVARRLGIEVVCKDLLDVPRQSWSQTVRDLIDHHDPALILITLRNTDSLTVEDYEGGEAQEAEGGAYFPIERTKELMAAIRGVSDLKIAVGGFAFSLLAEQLMHYLRPDLGVFGGGDAFFANFERVIQGEYEDVTNLLFFQGERLFSNSRKFYPPLAEAEYTPRAIEEMMAFYESFPSPGFLGAPVEIMRGCSHTCVFCSEPYVGGSQVSYRDLSAVMGDIEILVDHGLTQIYIISSELNPEGNEFVLQLADRILAFNQLHPEERKITWFGANYLLRFREDEYERLSRSGFTGGWFDVTALDDENARLMRTPYRNKTLLTNLKTYAAFEKERKGQPPEGAAPGAGAEDSLGDPGVEDKPLRWTMFLGNPATTSATIRNTLRTADREGLPELFNDCHINTNMRVFDYEEPDDTTLAVSVSITPDLERTAYQQLLPSFAYPPALLDELGSENEITKMFGYLEETYLSTKYLETRDWHDFIKGAASPQSIESWVVELLDTGRVFAPASLEQITGGKASAPLRELFSDGVQDGSGNPVEIPAQQVVDSLLTACMDTFPDIFTWLGFPHTVDELEGTTPYELAVTVFSRWSTQVELFDDLDAKVQPLLGKSMQELVEFCVLAVLYRFNVQIEPLYRALFID